MQREVSQAEGSVKAVRQDRVEKGLEMLKYAWNHRANACVEFGELAVVIVQIFVSYTKEFGLQIKMKRSHERDLSRRMMWSLCWVLRQLEVTLVHLCLHLFLFGDTSLPRLSYD